MNHKKISTASTILNWLALYHKHQVVGLEHLPEKGPCLIAVNHSLATYDIALLQNEILKKTGRVSRSLMDRWFFKSKFIGDLMTEMGAVEGSPEKARELLEQGEVVCVAPGGMREAIRPMTERYQIIWDRRKGFARLAAETGTPIVLAACPRADDIYDVIPTKLSLWAYKQFKLPFVPFMGLGPTPLPKPVPLVHVLSKPIEPPKLSGDEASRKRQISLYHKKIIKQMQLLIGEAVAYRSKNFHL